MRILVTGGAGYIGSHTCVELLRAGHDVTIVDNLSNSKREAVERIEEIAGKDVSFHELDLLNRSGLEKVFSAETPDAVIHFAGLKAVGESTEIPLTYYHNNVTSTIYLCELMRQFGVFNLVFSSSCTVYGMTDKVPMTEDLPIGAYSPYGKTKQVIEMMLTDLGASDPRWNIALLRYFNPVGAHASGMIGEDPTGIPSNLMPYITQVAIGRLEKLRVFGDDYPTPDGTGIRDYIHVVDLAKGHLAALAKVANDSGVVAYNLGTGRGYSVLEVISAFEQATGVNIPYEVVGRRAGDIVSAYADPTKAREELGWSAEKTIHDICADGWRWQQKNPNGY